MEHFQEEDLTRIKSLLQNTSEFIAYFELAEAKMGQWQQAIAQQSSHLQQQLEEFKLLTGQSLTKLDEHEREVKQNISDYLSQYDLHQFQHVANESCEQVKKTAQDAISKSQKLLHTFQIRFNFFAVLTTILTAFIMVLYLNGELPWEMHHQAKNEREAGKVLLQIWPKLSQEEKNKILGYVTQS